MISVLIVDDHPVVREGMETMLSTRKGFSVVGLCADGESAVKFCRAKGCPDVIVCDIRMPKMDGFEMITRLRRFYPEVKVLLLAGMPLVIEVEKASSVGARGYLPKSVDPDVLAAAIVRIASDPTAFVQDETEIVEPDPILSAREAEVLEYLRIGKTRDEIATILGVGLETVKTHVKRILVRLDVPNTPAAVNRAYELGIIKAQV